MADTPKPSVLMGVVGCCWVVLGSVGFVGFVFVLFLFCFCFVVVVVVVVVMVVVLTRHSCACMSTTTETSRCAHVGKTLGSQTPSVRTNSELDVQTVKTISRRPQKTKAENKTKNDAQCDFRTAEEDGERLLPAMATLN